MKDHRELKQLSYDPKMDFAEQAQNDKKRVAKFKSPDLNKKPYTHYDPVQKLWIYSDRERVKNNMVTRLIEERIEPIQPKEEPRHPDADRIIELYKTNSIKTIASLVNRRQGTVAKVLRDEGVKIRSRQDRI